MRTKSQRLSDVIRASSGLFSMDRGKCTVKDQKIYQEQFADVTNSKNI